MLYLDLVEVDEHPIPGSAYRVASGPDGKQYCVLQKSSQQWDDAALESISIDAQWGSQFEANAAAVEMMACIGAGSHRTGTYSVYRHHLHAVSAATYVAGGAPALWDGQRPRSKARQVHTAGLRLEAELARRGVVHGNIQEELLLVLPADGGDPMRWLLGDFSMAVWVTDPDHSVLYQCSSDAALAAGVTWPAPEQTKAYTDPKLAALVSLSNLQPPCTKVSLETNTFQMAAMKHKLLTGQPYNTKAELINISRGHKPQLPHIANHPMRQCISTCLATEAWQRPRISQQLRDLSTWFDDAADLTAMFKGSVSLLNNKGHNKRDVFIRKLKEHVEPLLKAGNGLPSMLGDRLADDEGNRIKYPPFQTAFDYQLPFGGPLVPVRHGKTYNGRSAEDVVCMLANLLIHYTDGDRRSKAEWLMKHKVVPDATLPSLIKYINARIGEVITAVYAALRATNPRQDSKLVHLLEQRTELAAKGQAATDETQGKERAWDKIQQLAALAEAVEVPLRSAAGPTAGSSVATPAAAAASKQLAALVGLQPPAAAAAGGVVVHYTQLFGGDSKAAGDDGSGRDAPDEQQRDQAEGMQASPASAAAAAAAAGHGPSSSSNPSTPSTPLAAFAADTDDLSSGSDEEGGGSSVGGGESSEGDDEAAVSGVHSGMVCPPKGRGKVHERDSLHNMRWKAAEPLIRVKLDDIEAAFDAVCRKPARLDKTCEVSRGLCHDVLCKGTYGPTSVRLCIMGVDGYLLERVTLDRLAVVVTYLARLYPTYHMPVEDEEVVAVLVHRVMLLLLLKGEHSNGPQLAAGALDVFAAQLQHQHLLADPTVLTLSQLVEAMLNNDSLRLLAAASSCTSARIHLWLLHLQTSTVDIRKDAIRQLRDKGLLLREEGAVLSDQQAAIKLGFVYTAEGAASLPQLQFGPHITTVPRRFGEEADLTEGTIKCMAFLEEEKDHISPAGKRTKREGAVEGAAE